MGEVQKSDRVDLFTPWVLSDLGVLEGIEEDGEQAATAVAARAVLERA